MFVLMATMILAIPTATTTIDTAKTSVTAEIINETTDLPPTLANVAAIERSFLYRHVQRMLRPHSKATICGSPHAPTCTVFVLVASAAVVRFAIAAI
uniref:Secreted peptide n=1 Tax=Romanomermis culicivorax TaxID=13658 RepID=A0A915KGP0_ROMCU